MSGLIDSIRSTNVAVPGPEHVIKSAGQAHRGQKVETLAASPGPNELAGGLVKVTLSQNPALQGTKLASRLGALAPGDRIYLVLRQLAAQQQPGVLYHVYMDLPAGSAPDKDDPHYVSALNFYNARRVRPQHFAVLTSPIFCDTFKNKTICLDQTTITIIPSRGDTVNANAKPVVGRIELVVQTNPP
jgi:hypothetical protein